MDIIVKRELIPWMQNVKLAIIQAKYFQIYYYYIYIYIYISIGSFILTEGGVSEPSECTDQGMLCSVFQFTYKKSN